MRRPHLLPRPRHQVLVKVGIEQLPRNQALYLGGVGVFEDTEPEPDGRDAPRVMFGRGRCRRGIPPTPSPVVNLTGDKEDGRTATA